LVQLVTAGRQTLELQVSRNNGGSSGIDRPLVDFSSIITDLVTCPSPQPIRALPMPSNVLAGDGTLSVSVGIAALAPEAEYRLPGQKVSATLAADLTASKFDVQLRPRGPFGFHRSVRVFLTIPTNFVGLRLPANIRNLKTSSDSTAYELTAISAGIAVAFEPWNYTLGKNLSPIPIRFLTGFDFQIATFQGVSVLPAWFTGISFTVPIFQGDGKVASQLGTSLALGPQFEVDLRDGHPYFLFNLGFNLFTFLAAK
jgi:hypothetical protein